MAPSRGYVFVLANINERNLNGANEVMFLWEIVTVPHLQHQVLCFVGNSCTNFQSLIPFRVETCLYSSFDLVP